MIRLNVAVSSRHNTISDKMIRLNFVTFFVFCHVCLSTCEPVRYFTYAKQRHTPQVPVIPERFQTRTEVNPANTVQITSDEISNYAGYDCEPVTAYKEGSEPFLPLVSPSSPAVPPAVHHVTPVAFTTPSPFAQSTSAFTTFEPSAENNVQPLVTVSDELDVHSSSLPAVTPASQISPAVHSAVQQNLIPPLPTQESLPPLSPPECTPSKLTPETIQSDHDSQQIIVPPPPPPLPPFLFGIPSSFAQNVPLQNPSISSQPSKVSAEITQHSGPGFIPPFPQSAPSFVIGQPPSFPPSVNFQSFISPPFSNSIETTVHHPEGVVVPEVVPFPAPTPSPSFFPSPPNTLSPPQFAVNNEYVHASSPSQSVTLGATSVPHPVPSFASTPSPPPHVSLVPQTPRPPVYVNQPTPEIFVFEHLKHGTAFVGSPSHENFGVHTGVPVTIAPHPHLPPSRFVPDVAPPQLQLCESDVVSPSPPLPVLAPAPKPQPLPNLPKLPPAKVTPPEFAEHPGHFFVSSTPLPPPAAVAAELPQTPGHKLIPAQDVPALSTPSVPISSPIPGAVNAIDDGQVVITPVFGSTVYPNFESQTETSVLPLEPAPPRAAPTPVPFPDFAAAGPTRPQSSAVFLSPHYPSPPPPVYALPEPVPILETNAISGLPPAKAGAQFAPRPQPPTFLSPIVVPEDCIPNFHLYSR